MSDPQEVVPQLPHLPGEIKYHGAASRHEYGTRNAGLIAGLVEAVRLQERIGRDRIAAHGRELAVMVHDGLKGLDGITVLTPQPEELRASITTFRHARADAGKLFGYLVEKHRLRCRPVTEQGLDAIDDFDRGLQAYIAADQGSFEFIQHLDIDPGFAGNGFGDALEQIGLGFFQALL